MSEKQRRIEAIRRVAEGETVTEVCIALGRSCPWYYEWKKRFQAGGVDALEDRRGRASPGNATPQWIQDLAIETRDRLVEQAQNGTSFRGIGAREVVQELTKLGIARLQWRTIHRILKKAGRIPKKGAASYCPRPTADRIDEVHQVDIWPRILRGGEKLYFFHLVDIAC